MYFVISLFRMEEYRKKVDSLEAEKARLQDLLNRSEKVKVSNLSLVTHTCSCRMKMRLLEHQSG